MKRKLFKMQFSETADGAINVVMTAQAKLSGAQLLSVMKVGINGLIQAAERIGGQEAIDFLADYSPADLEPRT